jgi:hypothetical protein
LPKTLHFDAQVTEDFSMSFWVKKSSKSANNRPWSKSGGWGGNYDGYGFQVGK